MSESFEVPTTAPMPEPTPVVEQTAESVSSQVENMDEVVQKEVEEYSLPKKEDLKKILGVPKEVGEKSVEKPKIEYSYATSLPKEKKTKVKDAETQQEVETGSSTVDMEMESINVMDIEGVDTVDDWDHGKKDEMNKKGLLDTNLLFGGSRMYKAFVEWGVRNGTHVEVGDVKNKGEENEYIAQRGFVLKEGEDEEQVLKRFLKSPEGKVAIAQNLQDETEGELLDAQGKNEEERVKRLKEKMGALQRLEMHELVNILRSEQEKGDDGIPYVIQEKIKVLKEKEVAIMSGQMNDESSIELEVVRAQIVELEGELKNANISQEALLLSIDGPLIRRINASKVQRGEQELSGEEVKDIVDGQSARQTIQELIESVHEGEESSDEDLARESKEKEDEIEEMNKALNEMGLDVDENTMNEIVEELSSGREGMFTVLRRLVKRMSKDENYASASLSDLFERHHFDAIDKFGANVVDKLSQQFDSEEFLRFIMLGEDRTSYAKALGYKSGESLKKEGKKVIDPDFIELYVKNDPKKEAALLIEGIKATGTVREYMNDLENPNKILKNPEFQRDLQEAITKEKHKMFTHGVLVAMGENPDKAAFSLDGFAYLTNIPNQKKQIETK